MSQVFSARLRRYRNIGVIVIVVGMSLVFAAILRLFDNRHRGNGATQATVVASAGNLICKEAVWNIGDVDATDSPRLSHTFLLYNHSSRPIHIGRVLASCGCLVADNYERTVAPAKSCKLAVTITVPFEPGAFGHKLMIEAKEEAEAPAKPGWLKLVVVGTGKINASLYSLPNLVNFGTLRAGEVRTRSVRIARHDGSKVHVMGVRFEGHGLEVLGKLPLAKAEVLPKVTLRLDTTGLPPGELSACAVIETENRRFTDLRVGVCGVIKGSGPGSPISPSHHLDRAEGDREMRVMLH